MCVCVCDTPRRAVRQSRCMQPICNEMKSFSDCCAPHRCSAKCRQQRKNRTNNSIEFQLMSAQQLMKFITFALWVLSGVLVARAIYMALPFGSRMQRASRTAISQHPLGTLSNTSSKLIQCIVSLGVSFSFPLVFVSSTFYCDARERHKKNKNQSIQTEKRRKNVFLVHLSDCYRCLVSRTLFRTASCQLKAQVFLGNPLFVPINEWTSVVAVVVDFIIFFPRQPASHLRFSHVPIDAPCHCTFPFKRAPS